VSGEQPETSTTTLESPRAHVERGPERRANWRGGTSLQDYVRIFDERGPGVDMPGVGRVAESTPSLSPEISSDCTGRESAVDEVPQARDRVGGKLLSADDRDAAMVRLVLAANELAQSQIESATSEERAFCADCFAEECSGVVAHQKGCRVGRVLDVIAELIGTLPHPNAKEAAADGEKLEAGDGIRPRELTRFGEVVLDLGSVVRKADPESALAGLEMTAKAFVCLLELYAGPNPESAAGVCEDKAAFRAHFAQIISNGGVL
jgi:hypothetical protein